MDKQIVYDRETGDYRMELDGRVVGWRPTYHAAELALDEMVYEALIHGDCAAASDLDAPVCVSCGDASLAPICPACEQWGAHPV